MVILGGGGDSLGARYPCIPKRAYEPHRDGVVSSNPCAVREEGGRGELTKKPLIEKSFILSPLNAQVTPVITKHHTETNHKGHTTSTISGRKGPSLLGTGRKEQGWRRSDITPPPPPPLPL